MVSGPS
jgi:hypothetical protein